jgi:hypothetical protein
LGAFSGAVCGASKMQASGVLYSAGCCRLARASQNSGIRWAKNEKNASSPYAMPFPGVHSALFLYYVRYLLSSFITPGVNLFFTLSNNNNIIKNKNKKNFNLIKMKPLFEQFLYKHSPFTQTQK